MKKILSLFALLAVSCLSFAQLQNPVHWTYSVKEISATQVELLFTAKLDAGWHLYSQYTDPNGPIAIEFTFDQSGDYKRVGKVREPKPHQIQ